MHRLIPLLLCMLWSSGANAGPKSQAKKRYFLELSTVSSKANLAPDLEKVVLPRLTAEIQKQFGSHPQLVTSLPGAPDRKGDATTYRRFLSKRGLAGAFIVRVDLTSASEEVEPLDGRSGNRLIVRLSVHMFGETVPGQTIGFTGDGSSSIRQDIGKVMRPRDREFTWQSAVELAVSDAITTSLATLSAPPKK
jgi:hypothetical protein